MAAAGNYLAGVICGVNLAVQYSVSNVVSDVSIQNIVCRLNEMIGCCGSGQCGKLHNFAFYLDFVLRSANRKTRSLPSRLQ